MVDLPFRQTCLSVNRNEIDEGEAFRGRKVALGSYFRGVLLRTLKRC